MESEESLPKMARATTVALIMVMVSSICWSSPVSWEMWEVDMGGVVVLGEREMDQMMMGSELIVIAFMPTLCTFLR